MDLFTFTEEILSSRYVEVVMWQCLRPGTLLKKETLAQMFSCELCQIFKNTFLFRTPPVAAPMAASGSGAL